jgi:hypothetical protein
MLALEKPTIRSGTTSLLKPWKKTMKSQTLTSTRAQISWGLTWKKFHEPLLQLATSTSFELERVTHAWVALEERNGYEQTITESGAEIRASVIRRDSHLENARTEIPLCPFCENLYEEANLLADIIHDAIQPYEATRLQLGARIPKDQITAEEGVAQATWSRRFGCVEIGSCDRNRTQPQRSNGGKETCQRQTANLGINRCLER